MDAEGHVTSFTRSNGLVTINTYNPANGFLTDIETKPSAALKLQQKLFPAGHARNPDLQCCESSHLSCPPRCMLQPQWRL